MWYLLIPVRKKQTWNRFGSGKPWKSSSLWFIPASGASPGLTWRDLFKKNIHRWLERKEKMMTPVLSTPHRGCLDGETVNQQIWSSSIRYPSYPGSGVPVPHKGVILLRSRPRSQVGAWWAQRGSRIPPRGSWKHSDDKKWSCLGIGDQRREAPLIRLDYYVINGTITVDEIGWTFNDCIG